jgi:hypothetical protein
VAKKPKTKADRAEERNAANRTAWEKFIPKIRAVQKFVEAQVVVLKGPGPNEPGRHYYSNLGFFLECFSAPGGASYEELQLYLDLIPRLRIEGVVKADALQKAEADLRTAIAKLYPV